ncbi:UNVERIFIED_ORG: UDP-glucose 4-epimerase [Paraburkholderia sediminicola]|nr:UDP-glucose 4-epimerase [Paraburkholderia sediminicola]
MSVEKVSLSGTTVAVLGGGGFIGTHLVNALLERGAQVRVYERDPVAQYRAGMVVPVAGDFADGSGLDAALAGADVVYHLISTTVPGTSNADPVGDVQSNLVGTLRLLQEMRKHQVKRIVYLSSGGTVYGQPSCLPVSEDHPLDPLCSYGIVKVAVEKYLNMYCVLEGLTATVLRVSNPYGGTVRRTNNLQGAIPIFLRKMLAGESIEIWGDGSTVRDYIYIDDLTNAMVCALGVEGSGVYNIGSGVGHSLNEVLEILSDVTGIEARVRYSAPRGFDVSRIVLDVSRAQEALGWQSGTTLHQGCSLYWDQLRVQTTGA